MIDNNVKEVREDIVVQVVTHNTTNYKVVDQMLMTKTKRLFWTPCVDLTLKDYEEILIFEETITNAKKFTTFIYSRTSLISLLQDFTKERDLVR